MRRPPAFAVLLVSFSGAALAAPPSEIRVFTDELAGYREQTLETHVNRGRGGPLQVMPEYSYGLRPNWELSLQLPTAWTSRSAEARGYRSELQYVAPHDGTRGIYWGANVELGRSLREEQGDAWTLELIPIVGARFERWHIVANPGAERGVSGTKRAWSGTPSAKASYRGFGVEAYRFEEGNLALLAWDGKLGRSDVNVGIGRGTREIDGRVLKAVLEVAF